MARPRTLDGPHPGPTHVGPVPPWASPTDAETENPVRKKMRMEKDKLEPDSNWSRSDHLTEQDPACHAPDGAVGNVETDQRLEVLHKNFHLGHDKAAV